MQLNRLVLPAPFGPINPTMCPAATSNVTWSNALTPPKRMLRSRMLSRVMGSGSGERCAARHGSGGHPLPTLWEFDLSPHVQGLRQRLIVVRTGGVLRQVLLRDGVVVVGRILDAYAWIQ